MEAEQLHLPLRKWNSVKEELRLPEVDPSKIKRLHIYDFDNTLFKSPLPNRQLYVPQLYQRITQEYFFLSGGWWNDPAPLLATSQLSEADGTLSNYWNHDLLKLSQWSNMAQDTVSIVLTGRKSNTFNNIIRIMLQNTRKRDVRTLEGLKFNAVCLKQLNAESFPHIKDIRHLTTDEYKTQLVREFLEYYENVEEITMYDDRERQISLFNKYFEQELPSVLSEERISKLQWFIIPVVAKYSTLPPYVEFKIMLLNINKHNALVGKASPNAKPWTRRRPHKSKYHLRWSDTKYGYFLSLQMQCRLYTFAENYLHRTVFQDSKLMINILNYQEYPSYIPLVFRHYGVFRNELYMALTRGKGAHDTKLVKKELGKFYRHESRYEFTFKLSQIMMKVVRYSEKSVDVEVYFRFVNDDTGESQYYVSAVEDYYMVACMGNDASTFNYELFERDVNDGCIMKFNLDLERSLKIETEMGVFAQMRTVLD